MTTTPVLIDLDAANLDQFPLCGIKNASHPGLAAKRCWLKAQFATGLKAKTLVGADGKPRGYIEYAPGESAWRGVRAQGYMLIHCLWIYARRDQGKGWGGVMVDACLADARAAGMNGVAVVTRDGPWSAHRALFEAKGFKVAATAAPDYQLLVHKFYANAPNPVFAGDYEQKAARFAKGLTLIRSAQCPHIAKFADEIAQAAVEEHQLTPKVVELKTCRDAQAAPTPYAVFALLYQGRVVADHQVSRTRFRNIMKALQRRT
jgi:hypothetical protein